MSKRPVVSLTTIVKDAANLLPDMIRSVRGVADEIVLVVDAGTIDDTRVVAHKLGAKTVEFEWCDDFAKARNFGIDHCRGEWILVLDADDRLLPLGRTVIQRCVGWGMAKLREIGAIGYQFVIDERNLDGRSRGLAISSGRLFPRRNSLRYVGRAHEEVRYLPEPKAGKWARVGDGPDMFHVGYDPSLMPGKYARNERLLKLRLDDDPTDLWAYFYLAKQYELEGRLGEAQMAAERALHLDDEKDEMLREHVEAMFAIYRRALAR